MPKAQESKPTSDYTPEYMPTKETQRAIYLAGLHDMETYLGGLEKKIMGDIEGALPTIGAVELAPLIKRARTIIHELSSDEHIVGELELALSTELNDVTQDIAFKTTQWARQQNERVVGAIFGNEPVTTESSVVIPPDWDKEAKQ